MMKEISSSFLTYDSHIGEEKSFVLSSPLEIVKDIALRKGLNALERYPKDLIIAADTIVLFNDKIYGKPHDEEDARRILKELSDNTHEVITAYVLLTKKDRVINHVISKVTFNKLSGELIEDYIKSGSPFDKAGGYGIQDNDKFPIIKSYDGSFDNIKGFPVKEIRFDLEKIESFN